MYDAADRESFQHLSDVWLSELEIYAPSKSVIKMVVANKVDKEELRQVTRKDGAEFASAHGALFLECSAKTKLGVEQAFEELCLKIVETPALWQKKDAGQNGIDLSGNGNGDIAGCGC